MQKRNYNVIKDFGMYGEAKNHWISDITKENIGSLIKTQGRIISTDNVCPIAIRKVYICEVCQRLHKITERDPRDEVPEHCIKCNGSLNPFDFGLYDDTQLLTLQDIFDSNRTEIFAYTLGDAAYYGKYREGDYVSIVAKVDMVKIKRRNRLILKIEEIESKDITIDEKIGKKIWKSKLTEAQKARSNSKYAHWKMNVLERDSYTCQKCKEICENLSKLEGHHIYNFSDHPHLRYDVENGITLCKKCHHLFHQIYRFHNDQYQLNEFLRLKQYIES